MFLAFKIFLILRKTSCCLPDNNHAGVIEVFNSTSGYLNDPYFERKVSQIYLTDCQLNKTNSFDTEALFFTIV